MLPRPGDLPPGTGERPLAEVRVPGDLVHAVEPRQVLAHVGLVDGAVGVRQGSKALDRGRQLAPRVAGVARPHEVARTTLEVAADRPGQRRDTAPAAPRTETAAFEHERRVGDRPPVVDAADRRVVGHAHVGEEHLVEHGPAGELPQGPDLHAGLVHVEGEVGDPLVLRHIGIGPRQQHAEIRPVPAGRPHLLAVDDPLVAVQLRPGVQPGEVRAGTGLAEQLAPRRCGR